MKGRGLVTKDHNGGPMRITSLVEQSKGQEVWPAIQGDILGCPIDKNTCDEGPRQRRTTKYLRGSYDHHIKYSTALANSLSAFM